MAYNSNLPADDEFIAAGPADIRENFRALKEDQIVNAGTLAGLSAGNASGNIPESNGTVNKNLNADLLDGYEANAFSPASHSHSAATTSSAGFMGAADKTKIDGIAAGAEVNQVAFSNVLVGSTTIQADSKTDTLEFVPGTNIAIVADSTNDRLTLSVTGKVASASNADTLSSYYAGNNSGQIPISNGILCTNLNSQYLSGKSVGAITGIDITNYYGSATYNLITTLPVSSAGTYDRLYVELHGGGWESSQSFIDRITLGNREGLNAIFETTEQGAITRTNTVIQCYIQGDGSVQVYLRKSGYTKGFIKAVAIGTSANGACSLGSDTTTAPSGTLAWSSETAVPTIRNANGTLYANGVQIPNINGTIVSAITSSVCSGNAATATSAGKLTTARTVSFTGAITGSVSTDLSGNVSITTANGTAGGAYDAGHSFANNGYQILSNGLIFQWGYINAYNADTSNVFPVAFPNACLGVQVTTYAANHHYVQSVSKTGFTGDVRYGDSSKIAFWFAIGY